MRTRFVTVLTLIMITMLLVMGSVAAQEQIVIRMYSGYDHRPDGEIGPAEILDQYLRMYEELNPHVKIENLGRELDVDKLITLYLAGELPDIIENDVKFLADFYRIGMLAPVPERVANRLRQEMFPSSIDFVTVEGQLVGIPGENMVTGLWYSREALSRAGIAEPPDTVQEFEEVGRLLSFGELPALIESGGWALNHLALAMYAAEGAEPYDEFGNLNIDRAVLQRTMEKLVDWVRPGSFFAYDGYNHEFSLGEVPMGLGYPWWLWGIKTVYEGDYIKNFGVALMPMGDSFGAFKYGHGYGVNRNSPHIDEVWKLLEWLSLNVVDDITPIGHMMSNLGSLPNVPSDILSKHYELDRPIYEGFIRNLDYVRNTPAWERIEIAGPALQVADGEINISTAVDTVITNAHAEFSRHLEWLQQRQQ